MNQESVYVFGNQIELPMLIHVSRVHSYVASRVTWHSHDGFELLFLLEGATTYEFAGHKPVQLHGGNFLVVPPRLVHRGLHDVRSPSTICGLALKTPRPRAWANTTFTKADLARLRVALQSASDKPHPFNPALRWVVRRLMDETGNYPVSPDRPVAAIVLRAQICAVLVEAMRQIMLPPTEPREFVAAAITYLRQHLTETVSMDDLVRYVGFSRARMFDLFKTQTGLTPNDYLQRLRIERAQEQLRQTNRSVTEIALATGFSSSQYFSTVFARYTGLSPTTFRQGVQPKGQSVLPTTAQ